MSFNDLAKKEAAVKKKALQEKESKPKTTTDERPVSGTKPVDPSQG